NAPDKVKSLITQALCLVGFEEKIFDQLPPDYKAMTIGGNPNNGVTNFKDICCADYVSLVLRAAGLDYHWTGADNNSNTPRANYYNPCPASADHLRQLAPNEPYLPGDILTYSYGAPNAQHVNLYIGDLRGTVTLWRNSALTQMSYKPGDGYTLLEGSINTGP